MMPATPGQGEAGVHGVSSHLRGHRDTFRQTTQLHEFSLFTATLPHHSTARQRLLLTFLYLCGEGNVSCLDVWFIALQLLRLW